MEVKSECAREFIFVQVIRRTTHDTPSGTDSVTRTMTHELESAAKYDIIVEDVAKSAQPKEDAVADEDTGLTSETVTPGNPSDNFDVNTKEADAKNDVYATRSHEAIMLTVKDYINDVLNDTAEPQAVAYKAYHHLTKTDIVIHFYLLREYDLNSPQIRRIKRRHGRFLVEDGLQITSEYIMEQVDAYKRKPLPAGEEDSEQHWKSVRGGNLCSKFLNWWLIVPRVQWDFFNLLYQMYTFDITHQGFLPKFVHFFTIPCNVTFFMIWLAQFDFLLFGRFGYGAYQLNASTVAFLILAAAYLLMGFLRKTIAWGVATTVCILVCTITGNLWYTVYATPGNPWYNPTTWLTNPIIWSYAVSFFQASSHLFETHIPPYITGLKHWETAHRFFCKRWRESDNRCCSWQFIVLSCACFPIFSVLVAWFSWYHLIGTEVIYLMAGIGYQHSSFTKYFRVMEKATLTGNPGLDTFPRSDKQLEHTSKRRYSYFQTNAGRRLSRFGIIKEEASDMEVVKSICTMQILSKYFKPETKEEDYVCMKAAKLELSYDA